jgi:integrase
MGTVFKRTGHDNYTIRYEAPPKPDGSRSQKMKALPPWMTKKQAEAYLRDIEQKIWRGEYIEETGQTVAEYLQWWLGDVKSRVEAYTWRDYESHVRVHITPHIGHHKLIELRTIAIQEMYTKLSEKGLATKSIKNIHGVLSGALRRAMEMQLLYNNPAKGAKPPKQEWKERKFLKEGQMGDFIAVAKDSAYWIPMLILITTGCRKSEALALKWSHFHEDKNILIVRRALSQTKGKVEYKVTKSRKVSALPIPESVTGLLVEHRTKQKAEGTYSPNGWICKGPNGNAQTPAGFGNAFHDLKVKCGWDFSLHGIRHGLATLLRENGVQLKAISERLAHSDTSTTENIYIHTPENIQEECAKVIGVKLSPFLQPLAKKPCVQNVCKEQKHEENQR